LTSTFGKLATEIGCPGFSEDGTTFAAAAGWTARSNVVSATHGHVRGEFAIEIGTSGNRDRCGLDRKAPNH
jgi:hypothetical protein